MPKTIRVLPAALLSASIAWIPAAATTPEDFVKDKSEVPAQPAPAKPPAPAAKPAKVAVIPPMDTNKVHEQYLEGDFDQAIRALEGQLRSKRPMTHAESVFVFKHLGVMYAANQATREKGKFYMHQLIHIEPTAKILDMYASDMIHLIFRNVQEEFEAKRARLSPARETVAVAEAAPSRPAAPAAPPAAGTRSDSGSKRTLFLAAAGATVAAGALALFFVLGDDDPETTIITVNE